MVFNFIRPIVSVYKTDYSLACLFGGVRERACSSAVLYTTKSWTINWPRSLLRLSAVALTIVTSLVQFALWSWQFVNAITQLAAANIRRTRNNLKGSKTSRLTNGLNSLIYVVVTATACLVMNVLWHRRRWIAFKCFHQSSNKLRVSVA